MADKERSLSNVVRSSQFEKMKFTSSRNRQRVTSMQRSMVVFLATWAALCISNLLSSMQANAELQVRRINGNQPIITRDMFVALGIAADGNNINGPSVIRVPDWVPTADLAHPTAKYYMYFGNHVGDYIRMAWAGNNIEGPWTIFNAGTNDDPRVNGRGVFDLGPTDQIYFSGTSGVLVENHIASPDVIVDDANQRFIMYFHGVSNVSPSNDNYFDTGRQTTFVATSANGLNFNNPDRQRSVNGGVGGGDRGHGMKNAILGNAYFRTFTYDGGLYAFSNCGPIWKAPNPSIPWETSNPLSQSWEEALPVEDNPIYADLNLMYDPSGPRNEAGNVDDRIGAPRHFATHLKEDNTTLEVWYTSRGEKPERIFYTTMDLTASPSWDTWISEITDPDTVHTEMLRPEMEWEGANLPLALSKSGSEVNVNQLRDPALFQDIDGKRYLFYSGSGEKAIGIAIVEDIPENETLPESIPIIDVSATDSKDGCPPELAVDENMDTRWASNVVGVHFVVELDDSYFVEFVRTSIRKGDVRQSYFDLHYSNVDTPTSEAHWTFIGSFFTSGTTAELEAFVFPPTLGTKFIRFTCNGNSDTGSLGNWNNFQEIEVWGTPEIPDISEDEQMLEKLDISSASASDFQAGYPASNVLDGDFSTRWSSNVNGATNTFTLADVDSVIDSIRVAFYLGNRRLSYFGVETSLDGVTWVPQPGSARLTASGTTLGLETFDLTDVTANYVRIIGYGNSQSAWTSITEVEIYGYKATPTV